MELSTWVTATIARLLGVVFGEIRVVAQAGESLPPGTSGASVTCALFPLGLIERLTPQDRRLMQKCAIVDVSVWERQSGYLPEQRWTVSHVIT